MLYTLTSPADGYDRIRLYPSAEAARATADLGQSVRVVAVDFDELMRRVVPMRSGRDEADPYWYAPAQFHPDGSVTAKGPLPNRLFV